MATKDKLKDKGYLADLYEEINNAELLDQYEYAALLEEIKKENN